MNTDQFVRGYLYPFLYDLVHAAGGDDNAVSAVYNFLVNLLNYDLTGLVSPLLFGPVGVWFALKHQTQILLAAISAATSFVNQYIVPAWNTLIGDVNYLIQWVDSAAGIIANTVNALINQFARSWLDAWNFAAFLYRVGLNTLSLLIEDTAHWFSEYANPLISAFFAPYQNAVHWLLGLYNQYAGFISHFAADPSGVIIGIARPLFDTLISPFVPLLDFLRWWNERGASMLTRLVNDPAGFVLGVVEPHVFAWLSNLLVERW